MIPDYSKFVKSIAIADQNVMIIFGIVALAIAAWYSIKLFPHTWQKPAQFIAWIYALLTLAWTVLYSLGG